MKIASPNVLIPIRTMPVKPQGQNNPTETVQLSAPVAHDPNPIVRIAGCGIAGLGLGITAGLGYGAFSSAAGVIAGTGFGVVGAAAAARLVPSGKAAFQVGAAATALGAVAGGVLGCASSANPAVAVAFGLAGGIGGVVVGTLSLWTKD